MADPMAISGCSLVLESDTQEATPEGCLVPSAQICGVGGL